MNNILKYAIKDDLNACHIIMIFRHKVQRLESSPRKSICCKPPNISLGLYSFVSITWRGLYTEGGLYMD
jgi:hypothetical protein